MLKLADSTGRLARWHLRLSESDFVALHRTGINFQAADRMSRLPTKEPDNTLLKDELTMFKVKHTGTVTDNKNIVFALEPGVSTPLQPVTSADGVDLTAQSLSVFIKAQATYSFR